MSAKIQRDTGKRMKDKEDACFEVNEGRVRERTIFIPDSQTDSGQTLVAAAVEYTHSCGRDRHIQL